MSIFEVGMLLCFGASWPMKIYKSLTVPTSVGKSFIFLLLLFIGYVFGIINKLLYDPDIVMYLYIINISMISVDMILFFRNQAFDKKRNKPINQ